MYRVVAADDYGAGEPYPLPGEYATEEEALHAANNLYAGPYDDQTEYRVERVCT